MQGQNNVQYLIFEFKLALNLKLSALGKVRKSRLTL